MKGGTIRKLWAVALVTAVVGVSCGGDDDDDAASETPTETTGENGDGAVDPADIKTDYGADAEKIRVGMIADLSGPFSTLVKDIVLAQQVFWDKINADGGIGGRQIELVIEDNKYDVPTHLQKFAPMKATDSKGVLILAQSTGSPHSAAIKADLEANHIIAIPLSWYSGWADPTLGKNIFEAYSNYCLESMNVMEWMQKNQGVKTVAIASFPGEAGQDAAAGAKKGAEAVGVKVVYDGEGKIVPPSPTNPNPEVGSIVDAIVASKADVAFIAANPSALGRIIGGAAAKGFAGKWTGFTPSYNPALLKSDIKGILDSSYYQSGYTVAFGTDVPGMQDMSDAIKGARPDAPVSDAYVYGWTEAQITAAILKQAAENGDLTRAGVEKAAFELDKVDFGGLAPSQTWSGDPNDYIVRETYMFKPRVANYVEGPIGTGHTGSELLEGPFTSQAAKDYDYEADGACYKAAG
jgi:ABC-type branched-subunit amino acid transport system substrate-binding protein